MTDMYEWWYKALQPSRHYVPLVADLSNLYSAIEWARRNDDIAREIVRDKQAFARHHFNSEFASAYLHYVLTEYAQLLTFAPNATSVEGFQEVVVGRQTFDRIRHQAGGECPHWPSAEVWPVTVRINGVSSALM